MNDELQTGDPKGRRFGDTPEGRSYFEGLQEKFRKPLATSALVNGLDRTLILLVNRPSPLLHAERYSSMLGGAQILIKREDLMGPGPEMIAAVTGQVMLAAQLGYKEVVTGSVRGRKGVIMASIAAKLGIKAVVFKDGVAAHNQAESVMRMWMCGANVEIIDPSEGHQEAREVALRYCVEKPAERFLVMGLASAPAPYPEMTRGLVGVVGREAAHQVNMKFKRTPDLVVARGRSAADAFGLFQPFLNTKAQLVCVNTTSQLGAAPAIQENTGPDAAGSFAKHKFLARGATVDRSLDFSARPHAAASDEQEHESLSEYPSVLREHATMKTSGRVTYVEGNPEQALQVIRELSRLEGVIPPIRTAQVLGWAAKVARKMRPEQVVVVSMVESVGEDIWEIGKAFNMSGPT